MTDTATQALFRCSRLSELMTGNIGLTQNQKKELEGYRLRLSDAHAKPLTDAMIVKMSELIAKDDEAKNGSISEGAKTFVEYTFLKKEYGYQEDVFTDEMLKGLRYESQAITQLSNYLNDGLYRKKNAKVFKNDYVAGTPDILLKSIVEDIKISSNLKTYLDACTQTTINKKYYWQGMGYLWLTGAEMFRLCYVLMKDDEAAVLEQQKRFYFKFNCNEEDPDYKKACEQIEKNNNAIDLLPLEKRVKIFEFYRDDNQIELIKNQVEKARRYYQTLQF